MNIVKELRKKAGIQQKELAIEIGVSNPTVSEWENGKKDPSGERLKRLSEYFGVDELVILGRMPPAGTFLPINRSAAPILGAIPCGKLNLSDHNPDGYTDLAEGVRADFALRCQGDSMAPTLLDGDLVLIRQQPEVENGQIAAVNVDGETTLKRVHIRESGLLLIADNPSYQPIFVPADSGVEIIIHGLAVGYTRLFC